ncbi:insulinase family protein [bacterium]|nr:insulinase family protein [bacterium]
MKKFELKNKIKAVYKQNKNTPRVGVCLNFSINEEEKIAGVYYLMARLLMQGTKNYTSEQLANILDLNAINFNVDIKQDYLRFRFVCLNEDFELATELMSEIISNSTFEEFDKEKVKMNGEMVAELDSARLRALDNYYKNLFENHYYGNTHTKILETLESITKKDILDAYENILNNSEKVLSFVGDIEFERVENVFNKNLANLKSDNNVQKTITTPTLKEAKTVEIIKNDAQQAQIIQGWIFPSLKDEMYPAIVLMNIILGSAGLSSRLFLELREKKGLAYTVRSLYESNELCASFSIYIATEPKNIQVCLDGFKTEIDKIKNTLVDEVELENAKNNLIGRQQFVTETNAQQANQLAYYGIMGLDFNFQEKMIDQIRKVTPEQIRKCAQTYFTDKFVISILKP